MRRDPAAISSVADIVADIRAGKMVVLVDDEDRENEGDLVFAADFVTADKVNFLARHGRGLVCMPITGSHAARLGLKPMVEQNRSRHGTELHRFDRGRRRHRDRHLGRRPRVDDQGCRRARGECRGHRAARPRVPAHRAGRRRAGARGPHRGLLRPRAPGGPDARGGAVRDHARGRHDGAPAGPARVQRRARPAHRHHRRPDRIPQPPRVARRAQLRARYRHRVGPLPPGRLSRPADALDAPGAGRRRAAGGRARPWCACTSRCRSSTCSTRAPARTPGAWARRSPRSRAPAAAWCC